MYFKSFVFGLLICIALISAEKVRYDNHKVYKIIPKTAEEVTLLRSLQRTFYRLKFWNDPRKINEPVLIMVSPNLEEKFFNFVEENHLEATMTISNVQELIDKESARPKADTFNWDDYHPLDVIYSWLDVLADNNKDKIKVVVGGSSYEGLDIKGIEIHNGDDLPGVIIESGIHAREWISPAASSWIINEAINSPDDSIWKQFNFLYFPIVNPDGYAYTHNGDRMWRKTRKPYLAGLCKGADMNRNYDDHWMMAGADDFPCSEAFAGSEPLSEIETKTLTTYLASVAENYDIYISFHSFSQLLMFPWGYTGEHAPLHDLWQQIGDLAAADLKAVHGTEFEVGNIHDTIYPASGSSIEWYYGAFNSTLTYTFECRDTGEYGFLLPPEQIIPSAEELQAAVARMLTEYQKLPEK